MPNDLKFDPATNDVIPDGKGGLTLTPYADTMLQLQLQCEYQRCWHDETLGSQLYSLRAFQRDPTTLVPAEVTRALNVIASRGRIDSIQVTAQRVTANRVDVQSKSRDTSTGQIIPTLTTFAASGGS